MSRYPQGDLERLSAELLGRSLSLSESGRAAWNAKAEARNAKVAERQAYLDQLLDVERQLRNINPLPAGHPALAQEPALLEQAAQLRALADAVEIPPPPWVGM